MSSWNKLNSGEDVVELPLPEYETDHKGNKSLFREVTFTQDEEGTIFRIERKGEITKKEKRISRAAISRQKNFIKFGDVLGKPLGEREKGITETRLEEFTVLWEGGLSKQDQKERQRRQNLKTQQNNRNNQNNINNNINQSLDDQKINQQAIANMRRQPPPLSQEPQKRGYVAPGLRSNARDRGTFDDEEITYEIRISNLPDSTQQDDIRQLMSTFFNKEFDQKPRSDRMKMETPPSRRLKIYCFKSRAEGDTNAIVDVKSEFWQKKCIELLDGQSYGYNIIKVEKSKPKKRKY